MAMLAHDGRRILGRENGWTSVARCCLFVLFCGGVCLAAWLLLGSVELPLLTTLLLWLLVAVLLGLSGIEWLIHMRPKVAQGPKT